MLLRPRHWWHPSMRHQHRALQGRQPQRQREVCQQRWSPRCPTSSAASNLRVSGWTGHLAAVVGLIEALLCGNAPKSSPAVAVAAVPPTQQGMRIPGVLQYLEYPTCRPSPPLPRPCPADSGAAHRHRGDAVRAAGGGAGPARPPPADHAPGAASGGPSSLWPRRRAFRAAGTLPVPCRHPPLREGTVRKGRQTAPVCKLCLFYGLMRCKDVQGKRERRVAG